MKKLRISELKEFLDEKAALYEQPNFIETDPIQIPHLFTKKEDIEISGFLTATISWGNRKSILKNAHRLMDLMGNSPYDFIMNHNERDAENFEGFVHRTFNSDDLLYFIKALQHIYQKFGDLEGFFKQYAHDDYLQHVF